MDSAIREFNWLDNTTGIRKKFSAHLPERYTQLLPVPKRKVPTIKVPMQLYITKLDVVGRADRPPPSVVIRLGGLGRSLLSLLDERNSELRCPWPWSSVDSSFLEGSRTCFTGRDDCLGSDPSVESSFLIASTREHASA